MHTAEMQTTEMHTAEMQTAEMHTAGGAHR
jgi:hypothetical protein